jgi:hypothetical protein
MTWTRKIRWTLISSVGLTAFLIVGTWAMSTRPSTHMSGPALPETNDIAVLTLDARAEEVVGPKPIPEFEAPRRVIPLVLSMFSPIRKEEYPTRWDQEPVGHVRITTTCGTTLAISVVDAGKNPLCFSVNGVRCVRGGRYRPYVIWGHEEDYVEEALLFCQIVRAVYQEATTGQPAAELQKYGEILQRSKGEQPPE